MFATVLLPLRSQYLTDTHTRACCAHIRSHAHIHARAPPPTFGTLRSAIRLPCLFRVVLLYGRSSCVPRWCVLRPIHACPCVSNVSLFNCQRLAAICPNSHPFLDVCTHARTHMCASPLLLRELPLTFVPQTDSMLSSYTWILVSVGQ